MKNFISNWILSKEADIIFNKKGPVAPIFVQKIPF